MSLTITIDELILIGFGQVDGQSVRSAVSDELARLAARGQIDGSQAIRWSSTASPFTSSQGLGRTVAREIYNQLARRQETPFPTSTGGSRDYHNPAVKPSTQGGTGREK